MKFVEICRYELEHRLRSGTTWAFGAMLLVLAFALMQPGTGAAAVHVNAPERIALLVMLVSGLFGLPVSAVLFGDAAVRDVQAGMDPVLYTTPVSRWEYLGGRFTAALLTNALVLLAVPCGLLLSTLLGYPETGTFGPIRAGAYVQPYLLFALPNMVFAGAVLFTVGILARHVLPVFVSAVPLFFGVLFALGVAGDAVHPMLSLLGPLGYHALAELTQYWTAAERNVRLVGAPQVLLWNRAIWLGAAAAVLGLLHVRFRFAHAVEGGVGRASRSTVRRRHRRADVASVSPVTPVTRPRDVPRVAGSFGPWTAPAQVVAVMRQSLAETAGSRWFAVVLLLCVVLTLAWGQNVGDTAFETASWPVTFLVAEVVLAGRVQPLVWILLTLYAGELVWRQREVGAAEIADAAPVPDGVMMLGRLLALVAMIVAIQAATLVGGVLVQLVNGFHGLEPGVLLRVGFVMTFVEYLLFAVLAITIHVVVNNKYLGHMLVLLAIVFTRVAAALGMQHHLLVYNTAPRWTYSDMNGLAPFASAFAWFRLYWAAWAILLGVCAALMWVRGRETGLQRRLRQARARLTRPVAGAALLAGALVVVLGGFVFYNTNVLNDSRADDEQGREQAEYEQRYARFRDVGQPTITAARLRIEIYPERPAVELAGTYRLVNGTSAAVAELHVYVWPEVQARAVSLDRAATPTLVDAELGYRIFTLAEPLQPGETMQLAFETAYVPRGFRNGRNQTSVVRNGAAFNRMWMPFVGYQPMLELQDDAARERFGLAPRPPLPGADVDGTHAARQQRWSYRDADLVHVDAVVGTAAGQVAVTPGVLRREWLENGRRYFHYETETPTSFGVTVFSGRYGVVEDRWNDVALQVFHHPSHRYNLARVMEAMKASLAYYSAQFSPYPDSQLRIVEIPRYGAYGSAHPHTIAFTEDFFLTRTKEGEFDQTFYGVAHEIAHTWWGGLVRGAPVRGHTVLSESLANYSAMMVVEKTYGHEAARRVYAYQMNRYLGRRAAFARDVPLVEVEEHPHIAYGKGAVALYMLRDLIGEAALHTALRQYLHRHAAAGPPYPTALDLLAELRAVMPDSMQYLLEDLFETVTLWELKAGQAKAERQADGSYVVSLEVAARKLRADDVGNESEVPMDDFVQVAVFAADGDGSGEPLHLEWHRIRSGVQVIHIAVPRAPGRAAVDPYARLIERQRADNAVDVGG